MRAKPIAPARPLAGPLCVALVATSLPAGAARTISCESSGYRYKYCNVDTGNNVRIERQRSSAECRQGYSWGYDRHGVWVDHGCAADFRVEGGNDNRNSGLAAGAAVAGLAIIAALAAQGSKSQQAPADPPSWAVGTFSGYDDRIRSNVELTILPGGKVTGYANRQSFEGRFAGDLQLQTERQWFRVERSGNGFVATDESDAGARIDFARSGGGY